MRAGWNSGWQQHVVGAAKLTALCASMILSACATSGRQSWMDHATLVLRPSHHQALLAYSFGGGETPPRPRPEADLATRSVAASLAAAIVVNNNPLPSFSTVDFKGGRFYIHTPRDRQYPGEPLRNLSPSP